MMRDGFEANVRKSYAKVVSSGIPVLKNNNYNSGLKRVRALNATSNDEWRGLSFNMSSEEMVWLQGAFVGKTHTLECAYDMQKKPSNRGDFFY